MRRWVTLESIARYILQENVFTGHTCSAYLGYVCQCVKRKPPTLKTRAPLQPIETTAPFELVVIDQLQLERSNGGYEYILDVMDHLTRYAQAYATKNKSSRTVAQKLYNDFIREKSSSSKTTLSMS